VAHEMFGATIPCPAAGAPTTMSSCPLNRCNKTLNAASNVVKVVQPRSALEALHRRRKFGLERQA